MPESKGQRGREGERHPKKLRTRTRERGERNVLTRRFLSELPKLIISSGLAEPCQEQEPTAKPPARPGPPCSHCYPHPSPPPLTPQPPARSPALGPNRRRCLPACLPVWAGPDLAHCHRAFACSGVLIKSFIVLHSRKELRRNTEQDGAEGRRESERGEKKREKKRGRGGEGESEMGSLFFPSCFLLSLSLGLKRCLI